MRLSARHNDSPKHLSACVGAILAPGPADPAAPLPASPPIPPSHRTPAQRSPNPAPIRRASPRPALRRQQPALRRWRWVRSRLVPGQRSGGSVCCWSGEGRQSSLLPACWPPACRPAAAAAASSANANAPCAVPESASPVPAPASISPRLPSAPRPIMMCPRREPCSGAPENCLQLPAARPAPDLALPCPKESQQKPC